MSLPFHRSPLIFLPSVLRLHYFPAFLLSMEGLPTERWNLPNGNITIEKIRRSHGDASRGRRTYVSWWRSNTPRFMRKPSKAHVRHPSRRTHHIFTEGRNLMHHSPVHHSWGMHHHMTPAHHLHMGRHRMMRGHGDRDRDRGRALNICGRGRRSGDQRRHRRI